MRNPLYIALILLIHSIHPADSFAQKKIEFPTLGNPYYNQTSNPESIDLRPLLYPVQDQGDSNACAIFAVTAIAESFPGVPKLSKLKMYLNYFRYLNEKKDKPSKTLIFEEFDQFLQSRYSTVSTESPNEHFEYHYKLINNSIEPSRNNNNQIFSESEQLYQEYNSFFLHENNKKEFALSDFKFWKKSEITTEVITNFIRIKRPVAINLRIKNEEWISDEAYKTGKIGFDSKFDHADYAVDKHAVAIVGFTKDPIHGYVFIFRNSWGTRWGELGYGYITEKYLLKNINGAITINSIGMQTKPTEIEEQLYKQKKIRPSDYSVKVNAVKTNYTFGGELHASLIINSNTALVPDKVTYILSDESYIHELEETFKENRPSNGVIFKEMSFSRNRLNLFTGNENFWTNLNRKMNQFENKTNKDQLENERSLKLIKTKTYRRIKDLVYRTSYHFYTRKNKGLYFDHEEYNESTMPKLKVTLHFKNKKKTIYYKLDHVFTWFEKTNL